MNENKDKVCLKAIAPRLLDLMREIKSTTSENLATLLINQLALENPNGFSQETVRRRIYDVINVLSATGIIDKDGKKLSWGGAKTASPAPTGDPQRPNIPMNLLIKERKLYKNLAVLAKYKAIVSRNFPQIKPEGALPLNIILFGTNLKLETSREGESVKLQIPTKPLLYWSPSDLIIKADIPTEDIQRILEINPIFKKYTKNVIEELNRIRESGEV